MKRSTLRTSLLIMLLSVVLGSLVGCIGIVYSEPVQEDRQARDVINRTNGVLQDAREAVRGRRVYTGDLALAYSNQRYAVVLYNRGEYRNSIEYSLYARKLCYQALQANGSRRKVTRYRDEPRYRTRDDRQLKDEIRRVYPDDPTDDQAVLTFSFNLSVD